MFQNNVNVLFKKFIKNVLSEAIGCEAEKIDESEEQGSSIHADGTVEEENEFEDAEQVVCNKEEVGEIDHKEEKFEKHDTKMEKKEECDGFPEQGEQQSDVKCNGEPENDPSPDFKPEDAVEKEEQHDGKPN